MTRESSRSMFGTWCLSGKLHAKKKDVEKESGKEVGRLVLVMEGELLTGILRRKKRNCRTRMKHDTRRKELGRRLG